jgi:hypothetical protein
MSDRMYQKPGKLLVEHQFKVPGNPKMYTSKPGKLVWVDRHAFDLGMFVVWSSSKKYSLVAGDKLHEIVKFD